MPDPPPPPGQHQAEDAEDQREMARARAGEQELYASRVTAPVWGLWVPRVADELKQRFAGTPPTTTAPAPAEPSPLAPTPPAPPATDLDTPVLPPGEQPR
jgi:hypothetical protein